MDSKFKRITHLAVTTDPRKSTVVMAAVLSDGSVWCSQGEGDWVELQSIPGTESRHLQDGGGSSPKGSEGE